MKTEDPDLAYALLTPEAVRERCNEIFVMAFLAHRQRLQERLVNG
jgi:hypothetical protein